MDIRNVAIIAHVDHGKTTLVDGLLKQSNTFRSNEAYMNQELILDSNDQERERGITILAKNIAVHYKDVKINIIDTPGHSDFSGEVERTLNMAYGAILLVDAQEGPMPQTKFVLKKALDMKLKVIVLINKIDKKDAHIAKTISKVENLFLELAHDDNQLHFPVLYAIGREGKAWDKLPEDMSAPATLEPIFEAILKYIPEVEKDDSGKFQMQVSSLDWDSYKGKYIIGKIIRGTIKTGEEVALLKPTGEIIKSKIEKIFVSAGLKREEVAEGTSGDIVAITGITEADIGDTITDPSHPEPLGSIAIGEPTLDISIGPNTSPFMGQEGKLLTGREILKRIEKELQTNVAMKFKVSEGGQYILSGRGELHLCVFLETLSREGFEIEIGKPKVITKLVDGKILEPIEEYQVDVPADYVEAVKSEFAKRMGVLVTQEAGMGDHIRLIFEVPTKEVLGLRSVLLTLSKGTAVANSSLLRYDVPFGESRKIRKGVLLASEAGKVSAYGINAAQERGPMIVVPGDAVYAGMVVGMNVRDNDLEVNVCRTKHLTNMRSKGEDGIILNAPVKMSLEQYFGFIEDDELLEITPKNIRVRKKILDPVKRSRAARS
ncbi:MAG: GTP-binding protein [Patescibacteria group bacterium]|nr:GTP-binding protein [Patescibacteria group bacterium]